MPEETIVLGPDATDPRQRVTHAHVSSDRVVLHDHPPEAEAEGGITLPMEFFRQVWNLVYWKKPGAVEGKDEAGNVRRADVALGAVTFDANGRREVVSTDLVWKVVAVVQRWEDADRRKRMGSHNTVPLWTPSPPEGPRQPQE